jgi:hypothetical protein
MSGGEPQLTDAQIAELVALADGSLPAARLGAARARVERSAELRALLERQRRAVTRVRALDLRAPARLHAQVQAAGNRPQPRARRRSLAFAGSLAATLAAALIALLVLPGGTPAGPTVVAAAELAIRGPSAPAPAPSRSEPALLAASVAGVRFPNYGATFGWEAVGRRRDELAGRVTRTVFYERRGRRIAYSIVAGRRLAWPQEPRRARRKGVELRSLERAGTTIVTWLREGHTCVLSGRRVPRGRLLELAAWSGKGAITF